MTQRERNEFDLPAYAKDYYMDLKETYIDGAIFGAISLFILELIIIGLFFLIKWII